MLHPPPHGLPSAPWSARDLARASGTAQIHANKRKRLTHFAGILAATCLSTSRWPRIHAPIASSRARSRRRHGSDAGLRMMRCCCRAASSARASPCFFLSVFFFYCLNWRDASIWWWKEELLLRTPQTAARRRAWWEMNVIALSFLKVDSISRCFVKSSQVKFYFILYYNIVWDMCSQLEIKKRKVTTKYVFFEAPWNGSENTGGKMNVIRLFYDLFTI